MKGSQLMSRVKVPRSAISLARRSLVTLAPAAARQITMTQVISQKVLLYYTF